MLAEQQAGGQVIGGDGLQGEAIKKSGLRMTPQNLLLRNGSGRLAGQSS